MAEAAATTVAEVREDKAAAVAVVQEELEPTVWSALAIKTSGEDMRGFRRHQTAGTQTSAYTARRSQYGSVTRMAGWWLE